MFPQQESCMSIPLKMIETLECGDCTACCGDVFEIQELNKPKDEMCKHLCGTGGTGRKTGCSIYNDRPKQCKKFECAWLQGMVKGGRLAYRPDKLGLIITVMPMIPFNGITGVFRVGKGLMGPKARGLIREMEKARLFFFEDSLYGPQVKIDAWLMKYKGAWNAKL